MGVIYKTKDILFSINTNKSNHSASGVFRPAVRTCYTASRPNLMLDENTKVICQGFTGKQVSVCFFYIKSHLKCRLSSKG